MGSGRSGLYNNTKGSQNSNYSPSKLHNMVESWANRIAKELLNESNRKRDRFNTACIAIDITTGKKYYGRNGWMKDDTGKKNALLFGPKGLLPKQSLNNYELGNCAEVQSINKALNAGAKLENICITTIHATKTQMGRLKKACKNCTYTFKGKIKANYAGWED